MVIQEEISRGKLCLTWKCIFSRVQLLGPSVQSWVCESCLHITHTWPKSVGPHYTSCMFHLNKKIYHILRAYSFSHGQVNECYGIVPYSSLIIYLSKNKQANCNGIQFTTIFNSHIICIIKTYKDYLAILKIIRWKKTGSVITKITGLVLLLPGKCKFKAHLSLLT